MLRFVLLAIVALVLVMALAYFALDELSLLPHSGGVDFRLGARQMPATKVLATWCLEAIGLTALFLLVRGRAEPGPGAPWGDGLLTGWMAWVFRGPLLVTTAVGAARLAPGPWWQMSLRWFVLYSLCGLVLAALAPRRTAAAPQSLVPAESVTPLEGHTPEGPASGAPPVAPSPAAEAIVAAAPGADAEG